VAPAAVALQPPAPRPPHSTERLSYDKPGGFSLGSAALEVDDEIWVASARSDVIATFSARS